MIERAPMNRAPVPQTARIDLSRVPSSMEHTAAEWARPAQQTPRPAPMTLREVMALETARMEARQAERERGR